MINEKYLYNFQLQEARDENDQALAGMRNAETELLVTKQKCQEQEEQLLRKSGKGRKLFDHWLVYYKYSVVYVFR